MPLLKPSALHTVKRRTSRARNFFTSGAFSAVECFSVQLTQRESAIATSRVSATASLSSHHVLPVTTESAGAVASPLDRTAQLIRKSATTSRRLPSPQAHKSQAPPDPYLVATGASSVRRTLVPL